MSTTLRVSEHTRSHAAAIAARTGESIGSVVEKALTEYERVTFWQETAQALAALEEPDEAADPDEWDATVRDGLDGD